MADDGAAGNGAAGNGAAVGGARSGGLQALGGRMERFARTLRERSRAPAAAAPPRAGGETPCPLCDGARFVRVTADPLAPDFGRAEPCECVRREGEAERRARLLRYSRLGALERFTFATLLPHGRSADPAARERYAAAVEAARRFAERPEGWLLIGGTAGCGKTHLAAAVANRAIELGAPALYLPVADLLDALRASYGEDAATPYERLGEQLRSAALVVLDDLDGYAPTPWAREQFARLTAHRFHAALPTVFVSAQPPEALGDERLAARLSDPALTQQLVLEQPAPERYASVGAMTRERLAEFAFERFEPSGKGLRGEARRNLEGAYRLARRWAERPEGWLVLLGPNGAGKTHLAAAIAHYRLEQGGAAAFATVPDLLDELRATFGPDADERFGALFGRLREVEVLVLDDFGAHQSSPWAQEKLYQLINHRHLAGLPSVVTSNLELARIEPRIASRLGDLRRSAVYELTAPDYRVGG